ncbi:GNAT family N-acetyltransferase [Paeniglutamicibacter sp. NPDC091659]|uniref:GNAT family N-acetyltransferase n=1 Tax=Paeniglutamicibacter sp. NPDC091659 TaxID=3364389 RepID=UPI00380D4286
MSETATKNSAIRIERFAPEIVDGVPTRRTDAFNLATSRGFHDGPPEADALKTLAEIAVADGVTFTAVHDDAAIAPSIHADQPVATYAAFPGTINVGGAEPVPVHQITSVTVSPTHRRRGILRTVMTQDLTLAREAGMPLAALTASEATIYGRFGFGRATERVKFALKVDRGAQLRAGATGSVVEVAPADLKDHATAIFAAAHARTLGSVRHNHFDLGFAEGRWDDYESLKPVKNLRAALHLDGQGNPDGFVTYLFSGWKSDPYTMEIQQLCAVDGAARRELVAHLGAHDLIDKVTGRGPVDDVLPTALADSRSYKVTALGDHLWLRILDIPAALGARGYSSDGSIRLGVRDDLQLVDGAWELTVTDGTPVVRRAPADLAVDATLDVRDLASLYLGATSATRLHEAGVLTAHSAGALAAMDALFATATVPYCQADF